jgi:hypothetical protein
LGAKLQTFKVGLRGVLSDLLERKMEKQSSRYMDPGRPFKEIPLLSQSKPV